jgi:AraC-like DNA-binding protein
LKQQQTKPSKSNMPHTEFDKEIALGIKKIIDAELGVHYTIAYLAEKAAMSESRLKRLFKTVFKTTLYAYLSQQRMSFATDLLQQNQKTLRQITKLTGFKNYSNFIRAFKKHTGLPPSKYRKQKIQNT